MSGKTLYDRVSSVSLLDAQHGDTTPPSSTRGSRTSEQGGAASKDSPMAARDDGQPRGAARDDGKDPLGLLGLPSLKESRGRPPQPRTDLAMGDRYRGKKTSFCPWSLVSHYHEWFMGKKNGELIQPYFTQAALLQCQTWDFYYVWHQADQKRNQRAFLVPTDQLQDLLSRINDTMKMQLSIPAGPHMKKFRVTFGEYGTPMPRFLGHAANPTALSRLMENVPPLDPRDDIEQNPDVKSQGRALFLGKLTTLLLTYDKSKRKKSKGDKSPLKTLRQRKGWGRQSKRVQRYLGLRGRAVPEAKDGSLASLPRSLDLTNPMSLAPDKAVVFVSMDIEMYEFNTRMITEIGFGSLDTRQIVGVPPGPHGKNWHSLVRGRHIRVHEHAYAVNRKHVQGCENNFNFGESEFVSLKNIPQEIKKILRPTDSNGEPRQVVLVGHSITNDINFIKHVGFDMDRDAKLLDIVDTQDMHRHLNKDPQNVGLGRLLRSLNIESSFLHNGGNDAVYTLHAMISLAIATRNGSLERNRLKQKPGYKINLQDQEAGWLSGGEMSDGTPMDDVVDWSEIHAQDEDRESEGNHKQPEPARPSPNMTHVPLADEEATARRGPPLGSAEAAVHQKPANRREPPLRLEYHRETREVEEDLLFFED